MLLLLIFSSFAFAALTMNFIFSVTSPMVFYSAILMLFFSVLSGFQFAEAYTEVQIARNIIKHPSLYGTSEVKIINENVRHMKKHRLYYIGLGVGKLHEIKIITIDGKDFLEVDNDD